MCTPIIYIYTKKAVLSSPLISLSLSPLKPWISNPEFKTLTLKMNRGAKRPAASDFDTTEFTLRSKRVTDAPSFDVHRAKSSRQHLVEGITLDVKRAESSRQHVRALNNQFASWIQLQMQNHPDELWEDGVKDYLSHASHIMEKFKDVVDWLRANSPKSEGAATAGSLSDNSNSATVLENARPNLKSEFNSGFGKEFKFSSPQSAGLPTSHSSGHFSLSQTAAKSSDLQNSSLYSSQNSGLFSLNKEQPSSSSHSVGFFPPQSTGFFGISQMPASSSVQTSGLFNSQTSGASGFSQTLNSSGLQTSGLSSTQRSGLFDTSQTSATSGSQSSGFFNFNQSLVFSGNQSFATQKVEESGGDEENELEQPTSPSLKKTEEKGVVVVHEVKCKVYVKPDKPEENSWKDMGMGQLSIKCKEGVEKAAKESKPTIIIRNDVGKILLNALIYPGIKTNVNKRTIVSIFHTSNSEQNGDGAVARTYLLRLKSEEETDKLAAAIQDYAPSA